MTQELSAPLALLARTPALNLPASALTRRRLKKVIYLSISKDAEGGTRGPCQ